MLKIILTILVSCSWALLLGQNSHFRGEIYTGNSKTAGGFVVFTKLKDTIKLDTSGVASFDLKDDNKRVFYFYWLGWKSKIFRFDNGICIDSIYKAVVPDTLFYRVFQKSKICPICKRNEFLIPIKYGLPGEIMLKKAKEGKVVLGGCLIYDWNPVWHCKKDNFEF